jgi:RimJ/RimL family protein N-acetyltransferase
MEKQLEFANFDAKFLEKSSEWLQDQELLRSINLENFDLEKQKLWFSKIGIDPSLWVVGVKFNQTLIGACGLKKIDDSSAEYWGYIGEKEFWGKGIGNEMIQYCIAKAKNIKLDLVYLHVTKENLVAIKLYAKNGFTFDCEENNVLKYILYL